MPRRVESCLFFCTTKLNEILIWQYLNATPFVQKLLYVKPKWCGTKDSMKRLSTPFVLFLLLLPIQLLAQTGRPQWKEKNISSLSRQSTSNLDVARTPEDGTVIYGCINYNKSENSSEYGIYSIEPSYNGKFQSKLLGSNYVANGGGVYLDGKYCFVNYSPETDKATYYEVDTKDWSVSKRMVLPDKTNIATDEAYDPVTGNIFGCFLKNDHEYCFGKVNLNTHVRTYISDLSVLMFGIACTPDGTVYGIGADGNLYKINKTTGALTLQGPTGISPKYNQSAICNPVTGKLYWAAVDKSANSGIYEVDTRSGKASKILGFPHQEGFVGIYIPFTRAVAGAPAEVDNLAAHFEKEALTGNVTFTLPQKTYDGNNLNGSLNWTVLLNGTVYRTGVGNSGDSISVDVTGLEGSNEIVVSTKNDVGTSPIAKLEPWLGYDHPSQVGNLKLSSDGTNKLTLTWDAPDQGMHNGYLDTTNLTYKIVRYPGALTLSTGYKKTSFSQTVKPKTYTNYWYEVTAYSHALEGDVTVSNRVPLGDPMSIPYSEDFSNTSNFDNFSTQDANNDGVVWNAPTDEANYISYVSLSNSQSADDWVFTPKLKLTKEHSYNISFRFKGQTGQLGLALGTSNEAAAMQVVVGKPVDAGTDEWQEKKFNVTVPEDSGYFLGFHVTGNGAMVDVDSINVEEGPMALSPDSVTDLKVTAGQYGELNAKIDFKTPGKALDGTNLNKLKEVRIYRNGELIHTMENPAVGTSLSYSDNSAIHGINSYSIIPSNEAGDGLSADGSVYVGEDLPQAPAAVKLSDEGDRIHISWEAPTKGANNGYIDASVLTYTVVRSDGRTIATDLDATSFDDNTANPTGNQHLLQYAVCAKNSAGSSAYGMSDLLLAGSPYVLPFSESFTGGGLDNSFWGETYKGSSYFAITNSKSQDGDRGCAFFTPKNAGDESTLYSGKISLAGAVHPGMTFYYSGSAGSKTKLEVQALTPDQEIHSLKVIDFENIEEGEDWRKCTVMLDGYEQEPYVSIRFRVVSEDGTSTTFIDNIHVLDIYDHNLAVTLNKQKKVVAGKENVFKAVVENKGRSDVYANEYVVDLIQDKECLAELQGVDLPAGGMATFEIPVTPSIFSEDTVNFISEVVYDKDEDEDDNTSEAQKVVVRRSTYPTVENLQGQLQGSEAVLTWQAPDLVAAGDNVVLDDVEDYQPFSIDNIGDWTMVDVDGGMTFGISDGNGSYRKFDNAIDPKSFMVFNAPLSGVAYRDAYGNATQWTPYSGDQMLVSFQNASGQSDDWMISPELPGFAQTISFWVKSVNPSSHGYETYQVLYSTTGKDLVDFQVLGDNNEAPGSWTKVEKALPEGTRYFAIRGTSSGHFALMVDDISYTSERYSELTILGYNVYKDKQLQNKQPISECNIKLPEGDGHSYQVSVQYDKGESSPSDAVLLSTGIQNASITPSFSVNGEQLAVNNPTGEALLVYTLDGRMVKRISSAGTTVFSLQPGCYIIKAGGKAMRAIIRK